MNTIRRCSVCKLAPGTTTILRDSGADAAREKIHYCDLKQILLRTNIVSICDECMIVLDECFVLYQSHERRICEVYAKTPTSCFVCHIDDGTVHDRHIKDVAPRERALQHISEICLVTFEPLFIRVCHECWHLVDTIHHFYTKMNQPYGQSAYETLSIIFSAIRLNDETHENATGADLSDSSASTDTLSFN